MYEARGSYSRLAIANRCRRIFSRMESGSGYRLNCVFPSAAGHARARPVQAGAGLPKLATEWHISAPAAEPSQFFRFAQADGLALVHGSPFPEYPERSNKIGKGLCAPLNENVYSCAPPQ